MVTDSVRITDLGCIAEVVTEVRVVNQMQVLPRRPSIARGQSIQFEVTEGSGSYDFIWREQVSGGELDSEGRYFSGDTLGQDRVEVHDLQTGEIVLVLIDVEVRVSNEIVPPMAWIPVGSNYSFTAEGGSGVFDFEWRPLTNGMEAPTVEGNIDNVTLGGIATGEGILIARDRFLGSESQARVQILGSLQYTAERIGKGHRESRMLAWPDIDGDGIDELVFGVSEVDIHSAEAGAVYIYTSSDQALLQRLTSGERAARFGRSLAHGDWNNDGLTDLAVGAYLADRSGTDDTGAVYLYEGVEGGGVSPEPVKVVYGERGGSQSGSSVAICDFNGDGSDDLAIGAWVSEISGQPSNSGVVYVYLNRDGGFLDGADQEIQGQSYGLNEDTGESSWSPRAEHRIAYFMSAGDLDNDGRCDLAVSSYSTRGTANVRDTGEVHVLKGMDTFGEPPITGPDGGLTTSPVIAITETESDANEARLGWRVLIADRDQDGSAELFVSQPRSHEPVNDAGAVYIYRWDTLSADPATGYLTTSDALETLNGTSSSDYFGYSIAVGDFNGDGNGDLVVGSYNDEQPGEPSNVGTLKVFIYSETLQGYEETPQHIMSGLQNSDNFGESVMVLGLGAVAGYAGFDDTLGPQVGRPYWGSLSVDEDGVESFLSTALDYPAEIGGARFGSALDFDDYDLDGQLDILVGVPYLSPLSVPQTRAGGALRFEIDELSTGETPVQEVDGFVGSERL